MTRVQRGIDLAQLARVNQREAQPFVKWVGGKRSLLEEILPRFPKQFKTYYEPFVGGGAVYFAIAPHRRRAVLADSNADLIRAYKVICTDPHPLIRKLKTHARQHSMEHYYKVRAREPRTELSAVARFLYLNKTCYNGLYRVNRAGKFNAPMGKYKNPNIVQQENILACYEALRNAECHVIDFEAIKPKPGDFVYFDPPYHPLNGTAKFTQYQMSDFKEDDQVRLHDFIVRLHRRGVKIMLSNSKTPFIEDLYRYKYFRKHIVHAPRFVNSKPDQRGKICELLITNYATRN